MAEECVQYAVTLLSCDEWILVIFLWPSSMRISIWVLTLCERLRTFLPTMGAQWGQILGWGCDPVWPIRCSLLEL